MESKAMADCTPGSLFCVRCACSQFVAGKADPLAARLIQTTRAALDGAIALCGPGVPFSAIGAYIAPLAARAGYSVVRQFCGHGIGQQFHMPPLVYHCRQSHSAHEEACVTEHKCHIVTESRLLVLLFAIIGGGVREQHQRFNAGWYDIHYRADAERRERRDSHA